MADPEQGDYIKKMTLHKGVSIVEALCDLLETEPLRVMDARNDSVVNELAQHLKDLGRPLAAERLRAGWEVIKKKFYEGMQAGMRSLQGQPPGKPSNGGSTAVKDNPPAKTGQYMMVPACAKCRAPVTDYPEHQGTAKGLFCAKCRETVEGPALMRVIEAELVQKQKSLDHITSGMCALKEQLAVLKASPNG